MICNENHHEGINESASDAGRDMIFISHATPEDNQFTKWLAYKLIGMGYRVWCDLLTLNKGGDFWNEIEQAIREKAQKFLYVLSNASNKKDGVLKELAVAAKTKKKTEDSCFIIPLKIDEHLSFDDINVEVIRLDAIDFTMSWAEGLQKLVSELNKQGVCKALENHDLAHNIFCQSETKDQLLKAQSEPYDSNWFQIESLPQQLFFHQLRDTKSKISGRDFSIPVSVYKQYVCSLSCYDDLPNDVRQLVTSDILSFSVETLLSAQEMDEEFIRRKIARRLIIEILNKAIDFKLIKMPGIRSYSMSGRRLAFWIPDGTIEKNKINRTQLVGIQKQKKWHFGVSFSIKLFPMPLAQIRSHIFFTSDGTTLIPSESVQHAARRAQGRNWWNNDWRNRLLAFMEFLSSEENGITVPLCERISFLINKDPICFCSDVSYLPPKKQQLDTSDIDLDPICDDEGDNDE